MPISKDKQDTVDMMFMSTMSPKGLAAAVLATIPLQQGIAGGELIKNIVFSIILFSIIFTSLLIPMLEKSVATQTFYTNSLNVNVWIRERIQKHQKNRAAKKAEKEHQKTAASLDNKATQENDLSASKKD
jgi:NhaP-type Na+/H+ or K+/H+ antiporter